MALVNCCTLNHHVVVEGCHVGPNLFILRKTLSQKALINPLSETSIFVVELGDEGVLKFVAKFGFSFDHLLDDIGQVSLH